MNESRSALVLGSKAELSDDPLAGFIGIENQLHSAGVSATASEARICRVRLAHALIAQADPLDKRDACRLDAPHAALPLAEFRTQNIAQNGDAARDLPLFHPKSQPQGIWLRAVDVEITPPREHDPAFTRPDQQPIAAAPRTQP